MQHNYATAFTNSRPSSAPRSNSHQTQPRTSQPSALQPHSPDILVAESAHDNLSHSNGIAGRVGGDDFAPGGGRFAVDDDEDESSGSESDEEDEEDSEDQAQTEEDRASLPPCPSDLPSQLELLRDMDVDAEAALVANQAYQTQLLEVMGRLDRARKRTGELAELIEAIQIEMNQSGDLRVVASEEAGVTEPKLPWFKYRYGKELPPNADGEARDRYLATIRSIPWTATERAQLKQEVIAQNHRIVAQAAQRRNEDLVEAIAAMDGEWFVESTEGLDWEKIALVLDRRTATACRLQWLQQDHPFLTPATKKWNEKEKERLDDAVEAYGATNWKAIALAVGTNRSPADCLGQWRNKKVKKIGGWTKEEDELLREAVQLYGDDNWQEVSRYTSLPPNSCLTRWTKTLNPSITRGKFTPAEDELLRAAVAELGLKNWRGVSERVGGRTDAQCRERWVNVLNPRLLDKKVWAEEEDATLRRMRDVEGLGWAAISKQGFDGRRTDNDCLRRYKDLVARDDPNYVPPRKGRPPKSSRTKGRPKKTAAMLRKEKKQKKQLEAELDELEQSGGDVVEGLCGRAVSPVVGKARGEVKGRGRKRERTEDGEGDGDAAAAGGSGAEVEEAGGGGEENGGGEGGGEEVAPPTPPPKKKKAPPRGKARALPAEVDVDEADNGEFGEASPPLPSKRGRGKAARKAPAAGAEEGEVEPVAEEVVPAQKTGRGRKLTSKKVKSKETVSDSDDLDHHTAAAPVPSTTADDGSVAAAGPSAAAAAPSSSTAQAAKRTPSRRSREPTFTIDIPAKGRLSSVGQGKKRVATEAGGAVEGGEEENGSRARLKRTKR